MQFLNIEGAGNTPFPAPLGINYWKNSCAIEFTFSRWNLVFQSGIYFFSRPYLSRRIGMTLCTRLRSLFPKDIHAVQNAIYINPRMRSINL